MTREELQIRQLTGQHLLEKSDMQTVVHELCGVQAQFMSNVFHALRIRCHDFQEELSDVGLVKNWTLRGTVHVFAESDLPLFIRCRNGEDYRKNEWRGYTFWNQRDRWSLTPKRQQYFVEVILDALAEGEKTREQLKDICRERGMTGAEEDSMFDSWGGGVRELCERGFMNYTVQEKKTFRLAPDFIPMPDETAKFEIARRYFTYLAPATLHDAMYYLGAKQAEVKYWLSQLPVKSAECDGKTYFYIENDHIYDKEIPPCLFLAGFDPLMLAYQKKESLYLPELHLRGIFNLAGIVMPSILFFGKVVGKWKKSGKKLILTLFEPLHETERTLIANAAQALWQDIQSIVWE